MKNSKLSFNQPSKYGNRYLVAGAKPHVESKARNPEPLDHRAIENNVNIIDTILISSYCNSESLSVVKVKVQEAITRVKSKRVINSKSDKRI